MRFMQAFKQITRYWLSLALLIPLWLLICPQICTPVYAQQTLTLNDQVKSYSIGWNLELLEDREGKFTIEEVASGQHNNAFVRSTQKVPNFSYTSSVYWARLTIDMSATDADRWVMEIENPLLNHIDIWTYDNSLPSKTDLLSHEKFGNALPFAQRKIQTRGFAFPLNGAKSLNSQPASSNKLKSKLFYFRFDSTDNIILPITLWQINEFYQKESETQIFYGFYYGALLLTLLYNLIIYFGVRQQSYLYYVFFVISFGLGYASFTGYTFEYLWPHYPWLAMHAVGMFIYPAFFFAILFQKTFLELPKIFPLANKLFNGALIFFVVCYPLVFINYRLSIAIIILFCTLYSLSVILTSMICWYRGSRAARFFVFAWILLLIGVAAVAFRSFGIIGDSFLILHSLEIGSSAEMILLSVGLADHLNRMRKDKEQAQAEALHQQQMRTEEAENRNLILETMVVERTSELAKTVDQLAEAQKETERQNLELDRKVHELHKANEDLVASQQQADRIFMALAEALPGTILDGKYQLSEKIGAGGFGAVFRAVHLGMQRNVAVKVFRPTPGNDSADAVERFRFEGVSASRVHHPNAVQVIDSGISTEGFAYLVMELLEGRSLLDLMRSGTAFTLQRCAEILVPVCNALMAAHEEGIVHRDIKPDNIFLHNEHGREIVKVVDFGVAKIMSDKLDKSDHRLTATGMLIGTPTYIAPERIAGRDYDGRADVYSLGIILYEMLTGRAPYDGRDYIGLLMAHVHEPPPSLLTLLPHLPKEVDDVVSIALIKDADLRPTAQQFAQMLTIMAEAFPGVKGSASRTIHNGKMVGHDPKIGHLETLRINVDDDYGSAKTETKPMWQKLEEV